ncbi:hypothetical protein HMPREF9371_2500 [Neisseria shayeganii 871]|uniref:Uncharacterized protein n=1 Tax=Neisseria shayeganii 871 TaxID=1032488 RepID=G4CLK9_9NEIS|nr:hypothetical protein HMPREF9371_2500 [Neisseria shayeganii 871]
MTIFASHKLHIDGILINIFCHLFVPFFIITILLIYTICPFRIVGIIGNYKKGLK